MNENYLITVTGTQIVDGNRDSIELTTTGAYYRDDTARYIIYREYDSENPEVSSLNTVKIEEDGIISVLRDTEGSSALILEKGRRHQCHYSTMYGDLSVGVFTDTVNNNLCENGGELRVSYTLDFNAGLVSKNEIYIKVTEKEVS